MSDNLYFGHRIGIKNTEGIIAVLNKHRVPGAINSA
nr:hypothetical protein [Paenibacillus sp. MMS18-CY102]